MAENTKIIIKLAIEENTYGEHREFLRIITRGSLYEKNGVITTVFRNIVYIVLDKNCTEFYMLPIYKYSCPFLFFLKVHDGDTIWSRHLCQ